PVAAAVRAAVLEGAERAFDRRRVDPLLGGEHRDDSAHGTYPFAWDEEALRPDRAGMLSAAGRRGAARGAAARSRERTAARARANAPASPNSWNDQFASIDSACSSKASWSAPVPRARCPSATAFSTATRSAVIHSRMIAAMRSRIGPGRPSNSIETDAKKQPPRNTFPSP